MQGFLHQVLTEVRVHNRASSQRLVSKKHHCMAESTTLTWAVHQDLPRKYPATWAQVSKAQPSGIASSVHSGEKRVLCALGLPRLRFVLSHTTRAGRAQTGLGDKVGLPQIACLVLLTARTPASTLSGTASSITSFLNHRWGRAALLPPINRNPKLPPHVLYSTQTHLNPQEFHFSSPDDNAQSMTVLHSDSTLPWVSSCLSDQASQHS